MDVPILKSTTFKIVIQINKSHIYREIIKGDMRQATIFSDEILKHPPLLSKNPNTRFDDKSDLLPCIREKALIYQTFSPKSQWI